MVNSGGLTDDVGVLSQNLRMSSEFDENQEVENPLDDEAAYHMKLEKTKQLRERLMFEYNMQASKRDGTESEAPDESRQSSVAEKISIYNFLPVALLGEGTYGQVFLVEDINTGKMYAMKKLDKREIEE